MSRKAAPHTRAKARRPADTPKPSSAPARTPPKAPIPPQGVVLTPEQQRRRRARSIAIASVLGFMVILFYVVTIVKLGPGVVLNRPL